MEKHNHQLYEPVFADGVVEQAKALLMDREIPLTQSIKYINENFDLTTGLTEEFDFRKPNRICDLLEEVFGEKFEFLDCKSVRLWLSGSITEDYALKLLSKIRS